MILPAQALPIGRVDSDMEVEGDPHWDKVALLLHGEGVDGGQVFTDSSLLSATTIEADEATTPNGTYPRTTTSEFKYGASAIEFGSEGSVWSRLQYDAETVNSYGASDDWTFEAWINPRFVNGNRLLMSAHFGNQADRVYISNGDLAYSKLGGSGLTFSTGGALLANTWHHVAYVYTGQVMTAYLNGVSLGGQAWATVPNFGSRLQFGCYRQSGTYQMPYDGFMDDIRVTKGVARYASDFTPPATQHPEAQGAYNIALANVLFEDDFERADSVGVGADWEVYGGAGVNSVGVTSGQLVSLATGAITTLHTLGVSEHIRIDMILGVASTVAWSARCTVVANYVDSSNQIQVSVMQGAGATSDAFYRVYQVLGGVSTTLANIELTGLGANKAGDKVSIKILGSDDYEFYFNDQLITSLNIPDSVNGGRHGFIKTDQVTTIESFKVTQLEYNVALASNGGVATASSYREVYFPTNTNNGLRSWAEGSGWLNTLGVSPNTLTNTFAQTMLINQIDIIAMTNTGNTEAELTPTLIGTYFAARDFVVERLVNGVWLGIPECTTASNNLVWLSFSFDDVPAEAVRLVYANDGSRTIEFEVYGVPTPYSVAPTNVLFYDDFERADENPLTGFDLVTDYKLVDGSVSYTNGGQFLVDLGVLNNVSVELIVSHHTTSNYAIEGHIFVGKDSETDWVSVQMMTSGSPTQPLRFRTHVRRDNISVSGSTLYYATPPADGDVIRVDRTDAGLITVYVNEVFLFEELIPANVLPLEGTNFGYGLGNFSSDSTIDSFKVTALPYNVALASNGGSASATSERGGSVANKANNGDRLGHSLWWMEVYGATAPHYLTITFAQVVELEEVNCLFLQDDYSSATDVSLNTTGINYVLSAFEVEYLGTDGVWAVLPDGAYTGNDRAWCQILVNYIQASAIRLKTSASNQRVVELEAYGVPAPDQPIDYLMHFNFDDDASATVFEAEHDPSITTLRNTLAVTSSDVVFGEARNVISITGNAYQSLPSFSNTLITGDTYSHEIVYKLTGESTGMNFRLMDSPFLYMDGGQNSLQIGRYDSVTPIFNIAGLTFNHGDWVKILYMLKDGVETVYVDDVEVSSRVVGALIPFGGRAVYALRPFSTNAQAATKYLASIRVANSDLSI